ncbi:MAG TPA: GAF domain-containing protein [Candidatus Thiothrix moscowensis]|uniref:GAF domain-containing protein n=1 Tax=unclassified Thiothrix TaxID=2636184 RepID=UPI0025E05C9C|nr:MULTISPECIES: GAF domain-containing protein [unclassified Thiothrix]HRJ53212.1 GAF domain-containing protein [Candidatus Thiothrix moscowensis]HRJ93218.1 GAF domain-containing protein [Candidatus Thiothrix moscowensis]
MNDVTATHPQHTNLLWKKISRTINTMQQFTREKPLATTKEFLTSLPLDELSMDEAGCGISVVYRPYNRSALELVVEREWTDNKMNNRTDALINCTLLAEVVNNSNGEPTLLPNKNLSLADVGFLGYKSVLIIPIHLHYKMGVNIGAIILHHKTQENAYGDTETLTVWQTFVERLTFLIQQHHQARRDQLSSNARIDLLQKLAANQLTEEHEIIREITQQIRQWYREDRLFIIMKHLLDVDSYVFAYNSEDNAAVIENFRLQAPVAAENLIRIAGSQEIIKKLRPEKDIHANGLILSQDEIRKEGIDADCQSWLGITFYHPLGFALGHIILHNPTPHAYSEVESRFFANFANLLGVILADFRSNQKEKIINEIKQGIIEQEEQEEIEVYYSRCENNLCNAVSTFLGKIYGVHSLLIARIDRRTQQFVTVLNQGNIAFDQEFQSVARTHIDKLRASLPDDVMQDLRNHAKNLTVEYPEGSGNKYLIAPMLVEHTSSVDDRQIIGCFITKAMRAGGLTAKAIDEISNALAYRVVQFDRPRRFDILNQFSKEVAELKPDNLTRQGILEIAHRHIKEIMFGDNLYISLYDKHKQEISFPLIYVDGQPKEQAARIINPNALGRTEEIILTKKPLRHRTKAESKAWYDTPGHGEFMGNHLASWIGVPIFSPDGIQGVIAAYHPNFDAIYSKLDLSFLSNIAAQVSGLLRSLELSETNRKLKDAIANNIELKKAQVKIAEQQHILSTSLLAQDLTHRINNSIGSISININQACRDIKNIMNIVDDDSLQFTLDSLNDSNTMLEDLARETKKISDDANQPVSVKQLLEKTLKQVRLGKRLDEMGINATLSIPDNLPSILAHNRTLFNSFYAIIDNAADALREQHIFQAEKRSLYLSIEANQCQENIVITISDNGCSIPAGVKNHLFEYGISTKGTSGFGLWRANAVITALGGTIKYTDDIRTCVKTFTIALPIQDLKTDGSHLLLNKKIAYILDDERSWRNIISRWLKELSFEVKTSSNKEEMLAFLQDKRIKPSHVFLDISLDATDGANLDGLGLISEVTKTNPSAKIILVTGYSAFADAYDGKYNLLIEKISGDGVILSKEKFFEKINLLPQ